MTEDIDRQSHVAWLRQLEENRQRRIDDALKSVREGRAGEPPPPTRTFDRRDEIRAAARKATEVAADLNGELVAAIRRDRELCADITAAASAWALLERYAAGADGP
jgi:hypothetical protein